MEKAVETWDKIYLWRKNAAKKRRWQVIRRTIMVIALAAVIIAYMAVQ